MLEPETEQRLKDIVPVFLEENSKLNLSAFRDEDSIWNGNVLDSVPAVDVLSALTPLPPSPTGGGGKAPKGLGGEGLHILDLGTGGGFPLFPLAILLPDAQLTGLDATQKKVDAVERMMGTLGITNVSLVCGRAEKLGHDPEHREQYDVVLSRAVAPTNVLLELCAPFAKVGGHVILWKSMKVDEELQDSLLARAELSCQLSDQHEYELPKDWGRRQLLIFEKRHQTSEKYPRDVGIPKKNPLV